VTAGEQTGQSSDRDSTYTSQQTAAITTRQQQRWQRVAASAVAVQLNERARTCASLELAVKSSSIGASVDLQHRQDHRHKQRGTDSKASRSSAAAQQRSLHVHTSRLSQAMRYAMYNSLQRKRSLLWSCALSESFAAASVLSTAWGAAGWGGGRSASSWSRAGGRTCRRARNGLQNTSKVERKRERDSER